MQLLTGHAVGRQALGLLPHRVRLTSGAAAFVVLCLAGISTSGPAAAQSPFDTTIKVTPTSAPDGGVFHVTGTTSCTQTDVTLTFTNYDGDFDYELQHARIVSQDRNGTTYYALDYVVPARAAPGAASMFADNRCGDPDAGASPAVDVTITKAPMRLTVTGSRTLTVTGTRCYGDADGKVTVRSSRGPAVVASLKADRFTASFTGTPGPVTFSVGAPDCRGSHPASVSARFAARSASPSPRPSRTSPPATPPATPSRAVSPTASVRPSPSAPSPSPSSSPATGTADPPREPEATVPWLLYGLAAAVLVGGTGAGVWRARR